MHCNLLFIYIVSMAKGVFTEGVFCGVTTDHHGPSGTFTSPFYPGYYYNLRCGQMFEVNKWQIVELTFDTFEVENYRSLPCDMWDSVSIFDGPDMKSPRLGQYCGTTVPGPVRSTGHQLYLYLHTDATGTGLYIWRGFNGTYRAVGDGNNCRLPNTSNSRELVSLPGGKGLVMCDLVTDGGGWIVIQRRVKGDVLFNRTWDTYTKGFGSLVGDFWIGLQNIYNLCHISCSLRAEISYNGRKYFSQHQLFRVSGADDHYRLMLRQQGRLVVKNTATDDLLDGSYHTVNSQRFSTWDADHDSSTGDNCAASRGGAGWWWNRCGFVNPNGRWASTSFPSAMYWISVNGYSVTFESQSVTSTELKLRVGPGVEYTRVDTRPISAGVTPDDGEPTTTPGVTTATTTTTTIESTVAAVTTSTPPPEPTVTEATDEETEDPNGAQCNTGSLPGLALCVMAALLILA